MNYYIQGDAANAERIKAAFEKLGYDVTGFDMCNDNILFFTYELEGDGKVISTTNANLYTANLIKTHPDYKELELPVEPKFKIGDWIVSPNGSQYLIAYIDKEDNRYLFEINEYTGEPMHYEDVQVVDGQYHLWTIADAKDGDVLVNQNGEMPFVFKSRKDNHIYCYCAYTNHKDIFFEKFLDDGKELHWINLLHEQVQHANKEQRDLLFAKMKEAGYEWDEKKKELRKIQPHYDIANFHAGMSVLVRDSDEHKWLYTIFGIYNKDNLLYPFVVVNMRGYEQCIPFNEETKHLLGTTDVCSEEYINW